MQFSTSTLFVLATAIMSTLVAAAPTPTPQTPAVCGCTNSCILACPPKKTCFCPQFCDTTIMPLCPGDSQ